MAGLADAINAAVAASRKGPNCTTRDILAALDDDDRAYLIGVLARPSKEYPTPVIAATLNQQGHAITVGTLNRHRRGHCSCR